MPLFTKSLLPALGGVLVATLCLAARVPADCRVEVGFGGVIPSAARLFPVAVTIRNTVGPTAGRIVLSQPDATGDGEVHYVTRFTSAPPSIKRFALLPRVERGRELRLEIVFSDHFLPVGERLKPKRSAQPLVLCLDVPRTQRGWSLSGEYRSVTVERADFPGEPVALDGVHAVAVSGAAFATLERGQVEALRQWIRTGGRILFTDPAGANSGRGNVGRLCAGAAPDLGRPGCHALGAGLVASMGSAAVPDQSFGNAGPAFAGRLFPPRDKDRVGHWGARGLLTQMWRTRRAYGLGGLLWLLLIIAAYVCAIGPLDRWIVRRLRRPYLTWVLFPATIAAFSAIAFGYSRMVNVGAMRAVRVTVVDTAGDADTARGRAFLWLYSARNAGYVLEPAHAGTALSSREAALGAGRAAGVNVIQDADPRMEARIPIFSAKMFDAAWYMPWPHGVTVTQSGDGVAVTMPRELEVRAALLAGTAGLHTLRQDGEIWRTAGKHESWNTALGRLSSSLGIHHDSGWRIFDPPDEARLMPTEEALRAYLLCLSFPRPDEPADQSAPYYPGNVHQDARNYHESSLDIRRRLDAGRVLLLFTAPDSGLRPIEIRGAKPRTAEVNLVRVFLPGQKGPS